jgi:hypothetical protein
VLWGHWIGSWHLAVKMGGGFCARAFFACCVGVFCYCILVAPSADELWGVLLPRLTCWSSMLQIGSSANSSCGVCVCKVLECCVCRQVERGTCWDGVIGGICFGGRVVFPVQLQQSLPRNEFFQLHHRGRCSSLIMLCTMLYIGRWCFLPSMPIRHDLVLNRIGLGSFTVKPWLFG